MLEPARPRIDRRNGVGRGSFRPSRCGGNAGDGAVGGFGLVTESGRRGSSARMSSRPERQAKPLRHGIDCNIGRHQFLHAKRNRAVPLHRTGDHVVDRRVHRVMPGCFELIFKTRFRRWLEQFHKKATVVLFAGSCSWCSDRPASPRFRTNSSATRGQSR